MRSPMPENYISRLDADLGKLEPPEIEEHSRTRHHGEIVAAFDAFWSGDGGAQPYCNKFVF